MAMNLLGYGLIYVMSNLVSVLPSAPTDNSTLWFNRTDHTIQAQDVAYIMNMYQERTLCERWGMPSTNWNPSPPVNWYTTAPISLYDIIPGTPNSYQYYYNSTNPLYYTETTAIDKHIPYTNKFLSGTTDWYQQPPFKAIKPWFAYLPDGQYVFGNYDYSNRWILGRFKTLQVSGFPTDGDGSELLNGTYYNTQYPIDDYTQHGWVYADGYTFTNSNGCMIQYNINYDGYTTIYNLSTDWWYDSVYNSFLPPWFTQTRYGSYGRSDATNVVCTKGDMYNSYSNTSYALVGGIWTLVTNNVLVNIVDKPCQTSDFIDDAVVLNKIPSYYTVFSMMDMGIFGVPSTYNYYGNNPYVLFTSMEDACPLVYPGFDYPYGTSFSFHDGQDIFWSRNYGAYIDESYWGTATTTNWFDFRLKPWTWVGTIDGLYLTYATNPANPTVSVPVTHFSSEITTLVTNWSTVNGVLMPFIGYSTNSTTQVYKKDFQEKYDVLKKLTTLVLKRRGSDSYYNKRSNPSYNTERYGKIGSGYGNTAAEALAAAIANQNVYTQTVAYYYEFPPQIRTSIYKGDYGVGDPVVWYEYYCSFQGQSGWVQSWMSSNNVSQSLAYIKAQKYAYGTTSNFFDSACNLSLIETNYTRCDLQSVGRTNLHRQVINVDPRLPPWIPSVDGESSTGGFSILDSFIMVKFTMEY